MAEPGEVQFSLWLTQQLRLRDWSQSDLARRAGVSTQTVSRWLSGQRLPDYGSCVNLAQALAVPVGAVLAVSGHEVETTSRPAPRSVLDDLETLRARMPIPVPHVPQLVSAGRGSAVVADGHVYLPPEDAKPGLIAATVTGNCMAPQIEDGDKIVIDTEATPEVGRVVVYVADGEERVHVKLLVTGSRKEGVYLVGMDGSSVRVDERVRYIGTVTMVIKRLRRQT